MAKFDYQNYGVNSAEWARLRKDIIFSWAGNRCEACRVKSKETYFWHGFYAVPFDSSSFPAGSAILKASGIYKCQLHLAHISNDKKDMRRKNLLSLCACCHHLFDEHKNERDKWLFDDELGHFVLKCNNIAFSSVVADIDDPDLITHYGIY